MSIRDASVTVMEVQLLYHCCPKAPCNLHGYSHMKECKQTHPQVPSCGVREKLASSDVEMIVSCFWNVPSSYSSRNIYYLYLALPLRFYLLLPEKSTRTRNPQPIHLFHRKSSIQHQDTKVDTGTTAMPTCLNSFANTTLSDVISSVAGITVPTLVIYTSIAIIATIFFGIGFTQLRNI